MCIALLILVGTFAVGTLVGWFVHWMMHRPWSKWLYKSHMTHHLKTYPPNDLLSEQYRSAGADNGVFVFVPIITFACVLLCVALYFLGISLSTLILVCGIIAVLGAGHDLLHTQYHLKDSKLNRFKWFQRLRAVHFYHHRRMNRNLGIIFMGWDRVLRTFRNP